MRRLREAEREIGGRFDLLQLPGQVRWEARRGRRNFDHASEEGHQTAVVS